MGEGEEESKKWQERFQMLFIRKSSIKYCPLKEGQAGGRTMDDGLQVDLAGQDEDKTEQWLYCVESPQDSTKQPTD